MEIRDQVIIKGSEGLVKVYIIPFVIIFAFFLEKSYFWSFGYRNWFVKENITVRGEIPVNIILCTLMYGL